LLRKLIRSLMEKQEKDVTNTELALATGVCDATISKFFNYKNELTFTTLVQTVRFLAADKEDEIINDIADEMIETENRLNCRLLMEYASTKRNFGLLEKLINSQMTAPKENKDWAEVYRISLHYQKRDKSNQELLDMIYKYKPKTKETTLFSQIIHARILYMMQEYKMMFKIAKSLEKDIEQIKNVFIRESFTARLCEIFAHGYLYLKADVKKARYYANTVINFKLLCPNFTSHMYHLLGTSFLFEDYEASVSYFDKYYHMLRDQGRSDMAKKVKDLDIFFAKVLWGQETSESETDDTLEKMHYYARLGKSSDVKNLMYEKLSEDPFALCYQGIAENNPELLLRSAAKFIENGNKFFAELPRKELANFPTYTIPANVICSMNIA
jgi:hypothetical protein